MIMTINDLRQMHPIDFIGTLAFAYEKLEGVTKKEPEDMTDEELYEAQKCIFSIRCMVTTKSIIEDRDNGEHDYANDVFLSKAATVDYALYAEKIRRSGK